MNSLDTFSRRWLVRLSNHSYQLLLAAYPSRFRRTYGGHMAQLFRDCCRDAYQRGGSASIFFLWIATLYDLGTNALAEHISTLLDDMQEENVMHALLSSRREQAKFMISSQQFPDAGMFRLLDCPCVARRIGNPLAL